MIIDRISNLIRKIENDKSSYTYYNKYLSDYVFKISCHYEYKDIFIYIDNVISLSNITDGASYYDILDKTPTVHINTRNNHIFFTIPHNNNISEEIIMSSLYSHETYIRMIYSVIISNIVSSLIQLNLHDDSYLEYLQDVSISIEDVVGRLHKTKPNKSFPINIDGSFFYVWRGITEYSIIPLYSIKNDKSYYKHGNLNVSFLPIEYASEKLIREICTSLSTEYVHSS